MTTIAWHVTPTSQLDAIEAEGLIPMVGERAALLGEPRPAIYLFPSLSDLDNALLNWLGEQFDEDEELALLKVEVPDDAEIWSDAEYEIAVGTPIPMANIEIMTRDLDSVSDIEKEFGGSEFRM
jgi:hypothetical protein